MFSINSTSKSRFRFWVCAGASPYLTVGIFLGVALACVAAAICEAHYGERTARVCFYDAPWFFCLFGLLVINLVSAIIARWPWHWKDASFVMIHCGIVFLFAGAFVSKEFGVEALLRLHTMEHINETQIIFAQHPPVVVQHNGRPSGMRLALSMMENGPQLFIEGPSRQSRVFPVSTILGKTIQITSVPIEMEVQTYWCDFAMEHERPCSRSNSPNNPAVQVRLRGTIGGAEPEVEPEFTKKIGVRANLLRFEVLTDKAGLPADFRSTVRFTNLVTHHTKESVIAMNAPAHYPTGFWRTALGLSTQFSQAQWNPADLGETTLHVSRDPGWPFKWSGSFLILAGLIGKIVRFHRHRIS